MFTYDVTTEIQKIVGKDIIKKAYLVNKYFEFEDDSFDPSAFDSNQDIVMEFVNGHKIIIMVSEWGILKEFNEEEFT